MSSVIRQIDRGRLVIIEPEKPMHTEHIVLEDSPFGQLPVGAGQGQLVASWSVLVLLPS